MIYIPLFFFFKEDIPFFFRFCYSEKAYLAH